jgi:hypothetical protein
MVGLAVMFLVNLWWLEDLLSCFVCATGFVLVLCLVMLPGSGLVTVCDFPYVLYISGYFALLCLVSLLSLVITNVTCCILFHYCSVR